MGLAGGRATGSTVRLRAIARVGLSTIMLIAVVACGALVILTTLSRRDARHLATMQHGSISRRTRARARSPT